MTNSKRANDKRKTERRGTEPDAPMFGELLLEAGFQQEEPRMTDHEGWLRKHGIVPDRRSEEDRRSR